MQGRNLRRTTHTHLTNRENTYAIRVLERPFAHIYGTSMSVSRAHLPAGVSIPEREEKNRAERRRRRRVSLAYACVRSLLARVYSKRLFIIIRWTHTHKHACVLYVYQHTLSYRDEGAYSHLLLLLPLSRDISHGFESCAAFYNTCVLYAARTASDRRWHNNGTCERRVCKSLLNAHAHTHT